MPVTILDICQETGFRVFALTIPFLRSRSVKHRRWLADR
jgi:hypothetical protein